MQTAYRAALLALVFLLGGPDRPPRIEPRAPADANRLTSPAVIPAPVHIQRGAGAFVITAGTAIGLSDPGDAELAALAEFGRTLLAETLGLDVPVSRERAMPREHGTIQLVLQHDSPETDQEAYRLNASLGSLTISAAAHAGLFYGLQTLRQLLPPPGTLPQADWAIPALDIRDRPRFSYRGMHLDVARHFFPVSFVKRYIDLMAMYKMNTFHWHLTEDQGWRIEIERYPRLTEVGAYRAETILEKNFRPYVGDGVPHGGFYTQAEIRDVVAYAASRYVTVIPEIEMPGHSRAALAAYPDLACTEGPFEVATVWGVHEDIFCPSERTFAFLENVLTEVMALFPSRYIHIGGDEAPKTRWEESDLAQEVIRREGLADEHELQSYFIRRIERFLRSNGRRLIGWDEILEGGLAPEATVMSWRGMDGGIAAAKQNHDVIMTPGSHVYFDHYQGDREHEPLAIGGYTPLEKVYAFEPVPDVLTPVEAAHVIGAQGNVWTEYMKTGEHVEYMVFPRLLALAEVVWSPESARDWHGFASRLPWHLGVLDGHDVNYRIPHVRGLETDRLTLADRITVPLSSLVPDGIIRYTIDGSEPTVAAAAYTAPLELPVDGRGVEVRARVFTTDGRPSPLAKARFARTSLRPAIDVDSTRLQPGLQYTYYEGRVSSVARLGRLRPSREGRASAVALQGFERAENFGLVFTGYLHVPEDGVYAFFLTSDDGSDLVIDGETVIDHDGLHSATDQIGMIALAAGYHPVTVRFFQAGGGKDLGLGMRLHGEPAFSPPVASFFQLAR